MCGFFYIKFLGPLIFFLAQSYDCQNDWTRVIISAIGIAYCYRAEDALVVISQFLVLDFWQTEDRIHRATRDVYFSSRSCLYFYIRRLLYRGVYCT